MKCVCVYMSSTIPFCFQTYLFIYKMKDQNSSFTFTFFVPEDIYLFICLFILFFYKMKDHNLSSKFPFLLQKLFIYLFTLQRKTQNLSSTFLFLSFYFSPKWT